MRIGRTTAAPPRSFVGGCQAGIIRADADRAGEERTFADAGTFRVVASRQRVARSIEACWGKAKTYDLKAIGRTTVVDEAQRNKSWCSMLIHGGLPTGPRH